MGATKAATAAQHQLNTVMTTVVIPRVQQATTYLKTYNAVKTERRRETRREGRHTDTRAAQERDGVAERTCDDVSSTRRSVTTETRGAVRTKDNEIRERVRGFEKEYCSLDAIETGADCQVRETVCRDAIRRSHTLSNSLSYHSHVLTQTHTHRERETHIEREVCVVSDRIT